MSTPPFDISATDAAVSVLIGLFIIACLSLVYWLLHGLDNEDAGR